MYLPAISPIILSLILSIISFSHSNCRLSSANSTTQQTNTGLNKNERLSGGERGQMDPSQKGTGLYKLSDTLNTPNSTSQQTNTNLNQQSDQQTKTEEQTEAQRTQALATTFITPINTINTLYQNIDAIDKQLKIDIRKRTEKNRFASTKDLIAKAQTQKATAYSTIITMARQLLADIESLPTPTELQQPLYRDATLNLGNVIQKLIKNLCEQPKNTHKMVIKKEYQATIQQNVFLTMLSKAAEFSRGFSTQQNNDIKRALTLLPQSRLPTITK